MSTEQKKPRGRPRKYKSDEERAAALLAAKLRHEAQLKEKREQAARLRPLKKALWTRMEPLLLELPDLTDGSDVIDCLVTSLREYLSAYRRDRTSSESQSSDPSLSPRPPDPESSDDHA